MFNSQTKMKKIKAKENIMYNNESTAKGFVIETFCEELREIDDMIYRNKNKNRNVIKYNNRNTV